MILKWEGGVDTPLRTMVLLVFELSLSVSASLLIVSTSFYSFTCRYYKFTLFY